MPICRNMPSMPKVRASSGTIGTMCAPMVLSLTRIESIRTSAIVVENSRSPLAASSGPKRSSPGTASGGAVARREGR